MLGSGNGCARLRNTGGKVRMSLVMALRSAEAGVVATWKGTLVTLAKEDNDGVSGRATLIEADTIVGAAKGIGRETYQLLEVWMF